MEPTATMRCSCFLLLCLVGMCIGNIASNDVCYVRIQSMCNIMIYILARNTNTNYVTGQRRC